MNLQIEISQEAGIDLEDIFDYSYESHGADQAVIPFMFENATLIFIQNLSRSRRKTQS